MICILFQAYFPNDDAFNFNYAQAKGSEQKWHEAEEVRTKNDNKTEISSDVL